MDSIKIAAKGANDVVYFFKLDVDNVQIGLNSDKDPWKHAVVQFLKLVELVLSNRI